MLRPRQTCKRSGVHVTWRLLHCFICAALWTPSACAVLDTLYSAARLRLQLGVVPVLAAHLGSLLLLVLGFRVYMLTAPAGAPPAPATERRRGRERAPVNYREPAVYDLGVPDARTGAAALADAGPGAGAKPDQALPFEEYDYERDRRVVENEATKKATHWVVNNKGLWARQAGRFRLPAEAARNAARRCAPASLLSYPSLLTVASSTLGSSPTLPSSAARSAALPKDAKRLQTSGVLPPVHADSGMA